MTGNQVQRYLKTEELYKQVIGLIPEAVLKTVSETYVRGLLDGVLSAGKIEGRLTALAEVLDDRLIEDWQRVVDAER